MVTHACVVIALTVAVVGLYGPVRHHAFVDFDDPAIVSQFADGGPSRNPAGAITNPVLSNWIPVTSLTWLADRAYFEQAPGPSHLMNVAFHAGASVALYATGIAATSTFVPSAIVAAIFAVHPVHVESVAWYAQRKDVVCGFFWMLALLAHTLPDRRFRRISVTCLGTLAMLSKPTAVTLPLTLVLFDIWPLARVPFARTGLPERRALWDSLRTQLPLLLVATGVCAITLLQQGGSGAIATPDALPFGARVANAAVAIARYLDALFLPRDLAVFYPHPRNTLPASEVAACAVAIAVVTGILFRRAAKLPHAFVGWLWFLGTLVPVLGLVQVGEQARADRYLYIPLIGISWVVVFSLAPLASRGNTWKRVLSAGTLVALVALAVATHAQVAVWRDSASLFAHSVSVTENNAFALRGYGRARKRAGHILEAREPLRRSVVLEPTNAGARRDLAETLALLGEHDHAIAQYDAVLSLAPNDIRSRINRGRLYLRARLFEPAQRDLTHAERESREPPGLAPDFERALQLGLARVQLEFGRFEAAERHIRLAERVAPRSNATTALRRALTRARDQASGTSSSTESSPGTPTRRGNP